VVAILHADAHVLVIEKPAGMLSVPGRGVDKQDCLSLRVQQCYADALIVHRLDMATSGLMLMARGAQAQSTLGKAFAERQVHKRYQALVHGRLNTDSERWHAIDLPIAPDWPNRPLRIICAQTGKPSLSRWRFLAQADNTTTRLELEPVTGRSHQLRVHLQSIGHPIVGDALYTLAGAPPVADRLMLHATEIAFMHPVTGRSMQFTSTATF
jgi:tRNA pseudouridine32 synthase/23S rRNA pseudouridine746 synthase